MEKLGLGIQELSEFKKTNAVYVDKTQIIHRLIDKGKYYFLSRPRRFGKSLLVNTLKELFSGNQELFENCWVYDHWNWEESFPVLHISFAEIQHRDLGLKQALDRHISKLAASHGIELESPVYSGKFLELIAKLGRVVILIDEYDKPIIDHLERSEIRQAKENRETLKSFYAGIKDQGRFIRFLFLTGVSKFSKVSIFSDLNHLTDITLHNDYGTLLGYTRDEIQRNYPLHLEQLANSLKIPQDRLLEKIREWYDGYSWDGVHFLHNPYSVLRLLDGKAFRNYWFATGTPTFLVRKLKETGANIHDSLNKPVNERAFDSYDVEDLNLTALFFQTGYFTVKQADSLENRFLLDFPNKEVREAFLEFASVHYADSSTNEMSHVVETLTESLEKRDMKAFLAAFQALFSSITAKQLEHVRNYEGFYHSVVFIVLRLLGVHIECEVQSNFGATDAVIKTDSTIFVLEFKNDTASQGAKDALDQIRRKKYHEPYLTDKRDLLLVGISFDPQQRNLTEITAVNARI